LDIKSAEQRSRNMAAIKSKNTTPELYIRHELFKRGYRYRLNYTKLSGKPDLYLSKYSTAIFVNGCYWHQHEGCKLAYMPKTNVEKWKTKLQGNAERDRKNIEQLLSMGIRVLIIWECSIKAAVKSDPEMFNLMEKIDEFLRGNHCSYTEL